MVFDTILKNHSRSNRNHEVHLHGLQLATLLSRHPLFDWKTSGFSKPMKGRLR